MKTYPQFIQCISEVTKPAKPSRKPYKSIGVGKPIGPISGSSKISDAARFFWGSSTMSASSAGWYHPTHGIKIFSWSFSGNFHVTQVFKDPGFFKLTDKILLNNYCDGDTMTYDQYKRGELDDHGSLKNDLLRDGWLMKTIDQSFGDKKVCSLVYTRGYPLSVASARKAVEIASLYIPADKDSKYSIELWDGVSRKILTGFGDMEAFIRGRI